MYTAIQKIHEAFQEKDLKHKIDQVGDNWVLRAGVSGKNKTYDFLFIKDDDKGNDVAVRIFNFVKFSPSNKRNALKVLGELQQKYRFIRFNLDDDGNVNVEYDFPVAYTNIGDGAIEILIRFTQILNDSFPVLMKVIWEED